MAKFVATADGVTVRQALAGAQVKLEEIRDELLAAVQTKVTQLAGLAAHITGADSAQLDEAYALANEVFCDAGAFNLDELSVAAHHLCDLIAHVRAGAPFSAEAIRVHVHAIVLLTASRDQLSADERAAILDGLKRVHRKFADAVPAANQNEPA